MNSKEKIDNWLSGLNFHMFWENHTIYDYANVFRYMNGVCSDTRSILSKESINQ